MPRERERERERVGWLRGPGADRAARLVSVQEVLSDVVALDYPFTPWNMLVLSDSKDAYTDAEWVPQVRTAKLPDLRTVVVRRLIVWLLCAVRVGAVGAAGARPRQGVGEAVYVTSRTVRVLCVLCTNK